MCVRVVEIYTDQPESLQVHMNPDKYIQDSMKILRNPY